MDSIIFDLNTDTGDNIENIIDHIHNATNIKLSPEDIIHTGVHLISELYLENCFNNGNPTITLTKAMINEISTSNEQLTKYITIVSKDRVEANPIYKNINFTICYMCSDMCKNLIKSNIQGNK